MRASHVEYHAPARFDDLLEIFVRVARIGRSSVTWELAAYSCDDVGDDDQLMVTAKQTLVLIDLASGARADPRRVPRRVAERRGRLSAERARRRRARLARAATPTTSCAGSSPRSSTEGGCRLGRDPLRRGRRARARAEAGEQRPGGRAVPVVYDGERVAELAADGCADRAFLERVAVLVAATASSAGTPAASRGNPNASWRLPRLAWRRRGWTPAARPKGEEPDPAVREPQAAAKEARQLSDNVSRAEFCDFR